MCTEIICKESWSSGLFVFNGSTWFMWNNILINNDAYTNIFINNDAYTNILINNDAYTNKLKNNDAYTHSTTKISTFFW